jgi:hypothetical protein
MIGRTCSSRSHEQNTEDKRQKYGVNSLCCINADAFPHLRAAIAHNIVVSTKQKVTVMAELPVLFFSL